MLVNPEPPPRSRQRAPYRTSWGSAFFDSAPVHPIWLFRRARWEIAYPYLANEEMRIARDPRWEWAEAIVPVRLSHRDLRILLCGRRQGGRPYLSEDLRSLS